MATPEQNREMAKRMKEEGVTRTTGRCPICYVLVSLKALGTHIGFHK